MPIILIKAGITSANINNSKYLFLIDDVSVDDDDDDVNSVVVLLPALWILNPKRKEDVPIKRETKVRIFCVIADMIVTGAPKLVSCCALVVLLSRSDRDNTVLIVDIDNNNNNVTKQLDKNLHRRCII
jgi:methylthioribose-1-phosphate isomerase